MNPSFAVRYPDQRVRLFYDFYAAIEFFGRVVTALGGAADRENIRLYIRRDDGTWMTSFWWPMRKGAKS
jgi:hypothetical protein